MTHLTQELVDLARRRRAALVDIQVLANVIERARPTPAGFPPAHRVRLAQVICATWHHTDVGAAGRGGLSPGRWALDICAALGRHDLSAVGLDRQGRRCGGGIVAEHAAGKHERGRVGALDRVA